MENFKMVEVKDAPRVELHNLLGLTGCEISINELPAKAAVPFVHAHKQNEEVYGVLGGKGIRNSLKGMTLPVLEKFSRSLTFSRQNEAENSKESLSFPMT